MSSTHSTVAVVYVPVLHAGYLKFFSEAIAHGAERLYLVGDDILEAHEELDYMHRKDRLRAVPLAQMQKALASILSVSVDVLTRESAVDVGGTIIMPKEDLSEFLALQYFANATIVYSPIFLRWNRDNTAEDHAVAEHRTLSVSALDREMMTRATDESEKSFDWWRQVGAVIAKDGAILYAGHNQHMPDEQSPYINGDPRTAFKRGVEIHLSTAAHAETVLIAEAARNGVSLKGASVYVTDFPCPYCARLIAHSGISKCFFSKGYAALDGEEILKQAGVELVYVDMKK